MKGRWLWAVIVVNLLVLLALAFVYPHLMVSPGALMAEHAALNTDCFACHAPLRGVSEQRCMACHAPVDIGLRTSKGVAIKTATRVGAIFSMMCCPCSRGGALCWMRRPQRC